MNRIVFQQKVDNSEVIILFGDITKESTDAIVNPANSNLILGGGVAGAIRNSGGPTIQAECDKIRHCDLGNSVITNAGKLKSKYVIHTVGPVFNQRDPIKSEKDLRKAVRSVFARMQDKNMISVTLPLISAGIFGYPIIDAMEIHLQEIGSFLKNTDQSYTIQLILYPESNVTIFIEHFMKKLKKILC